MDDIAKTVGEKWDAQVYVDRKWWQVPKILRHINKIVCGEAIDGFSGGLNRELKKLISSPLKRGISVGAGSGAKEITLLKAGLVESFDLFEYSEKRAALAIESSKKQGLQDRVRVFIGDAFKLASGGYNIVHWNNSLHHMMNTEEAIRWSSELLNKGGIFYMDDFVGQTYFQWTDDEIRIANEIRMSLKGTKYIKIDNGKEAGPVGRPNLEKFIAVDPSEAADSSSILQAVRKFFPKADIRLTGGGYL
jgi:SAM-dependent methyltransferase